MQRFRTNLFAILLAVGGAGYALIAISPVSTGDEDGHGPDEDTDEGIRAIEGKREYYAGLLNAAMVSVALFGCAYSVRPRNRLDSAGQPDSPVSVPLDSASIT